MFCATCSTRMMERVWSCGHPLKNSVKRMWYSWHSTVNIGDDVWYRASAPNGELWELVCPTFTCMYIYLNLFLVVFKCMCTVGMHFMSMYTFFYQKTSGPLIGTNWLHLNLLILVAFFDTGNDVVMLPRCWSMDLTWCRCGCQWSRFVFWLSIDRDAKLT